MADDRDKQPAAPPAPQGGMGIGMRQAMPPAHPMPMGMPGMPMPPMPMPPMPMMGMPPMPMAPMMAHGAPPLPMGHAPAGGADLRLDVPGVARGRMGMAAGPFPHGDLDLRALVAPPPVAPPLVPYRPLAGRRFYFLADAAPAPAAPGVAAAAAVAPAADAPKKKG